MKRYCKGLPVQIKEEEAYKIITNKAFTEDKDSLFEKIEPHKNFNTKWGTVYNRDLAEFMREEIMEMYPKDVLDIYIPRRDDGNRLMGPSIIELEFEKDILDPNIIIGG